MAVRTSAALRARALDGLAFAERAERANAWAAAQSARVNAHADQDRADLLDALAAEERASRTPLARVRAQRQRAQRDGSHVAADKLLCREAELERVHAAELAAKREKAKRAAERTGDAVVDEILAFVPLLDEATIERLRLAIETRTRARHTGPDAAP